MNISMGLAINIPRWSSPLRELKYNVEVLEANLPETRPDVILTSKQFNHSLIIDCKSRTLKKSQMERYKKIMENPKILLTRGIVNVPNTKQFKADPTIISFFDLTDQELINSNDFPFLMVLDESSKIISIEKRYGAFQNDKLNRIFPIDTSGGTPPINLYPFGENDNEIFKMKIFRELINFGLKGQIFNIEDLMGKIHPCWAIIGDKRKFRSRATTLMLQLEKIGAKYGLNRYLKRESSSGWKVEIPPDSKSVKAFQSICEKIESSIEYGTLQDNLGEV